jgi:hypothetical protein
MNLNKLLEVDIDRLGFLAFIRKKIRKYQKRNKK